MFSFRQSEVTKVSEINVKGINKETGKRDGYMYNSHIY